MIGLVYGYTKTFDSVVLYREMLTFSILTLLKMEEVALQEDFDSIKLELQLIESCIYNSYLDNDTLSFEMLRTHSNFLNVYSQRITNIKISEVTDYLNQHHML